MLRFSFDESLVVMKQLHKLHSRHCQQLARSLSAFHRKSLREFSQFSLHTNSQDPCICGQLIFFLSRTEFLEQKTRALFCNYRAVVRELVETEEEFGRDLQNVVEQYMKPLDSSQVPRIVRDNIDVIFSNLRQIANFHNTWVRWASL